MTTPVSLKSSVCLCVFILQHAQLVSFATAQTGPPECTYSGDVYKCDYTSMTSSERPIDYNLFSVVPQTMVCAVNGLMPYLGDGRVFSTRFDTIDESQFSTNAPASLTIDCGWDGSVYLDRGSLSHMSYVQWFKFRNCQVFYIGADTVSNLQNLDYFGIEGGTVDQIELGAFSGLTVEKLASDPHQFPRLQGRFEAHYAAFIAGELPSLFLYYFKNLTSVAFRGANLSSMATDTFTYNTRLTDIDISDNPYTELPAKIFENLDSLSEVVLSNIDWSCSCARLDWLSDVVDKNITLLGDLMCANIQGNSVLKFYYSECVTVDVCAGKTGLAVGSFCVSAIALLVHLVSLLTVIIVGASLCLANVNSQALPEAKREEEITKRWRARKARENWRDAKRLVFRHIREMRSFESAPSPQNYQHFDNDYYDPNENFHQQPQHIQYSGINNQYMGQSFGYGGTDMSPTASTEFFAMSHYQSPDAVHNYGHPSPGAFQEQQYGYHSPGVIQHYGY